MVYEQEVALGDNDDKMLAMALVLIATEEHRGAISALHFCVVHCCVGGGVAGCVLLCTRLCV